MCQAETHGQDDVASSAQPPRRQGKPPLKGCFVTWVLRLACDLGVFVFSVLVEARVFVVVCSVVFLCFWCTCVWFPFIRLIISM